MNLKVFKYIFGLLGFFLVFLLVFWFGWWKLANPMRESITDIFYDYPVTPKLIHDSRPALVFLPKNYSKDKSYPLVISIHGYASYPMEQQIYLDHLDYTYNNDIILILPEGNLSPNNRRYWDATSDCCAPEGESRPDKGYIQELAKIAQLRFSVDDQQLYLFGFSNGGYLSYAISCVDQQLFKGIAVFSGLGHLNEQDCSNPTPRNIVHLHGTKDTSIPPDAQGRDAASVEEMLNRWRKINGCNSANGTVKENILDISSSVDGFDTDIINWNNCGSGFSVTHFRLKEMTHTPFIQVNILKEIWPYLANFK